MRTEELLPPDRRSSGLAISPALLDRAPPYWRITDEHDRPVSLSRAGFVLHFGRSYKLWVAPRSNDGPLPLVRIATRPAWLAPAEEAENAEINGQPFTCLTFHVRRQTSWIWFYLWPREIYSDKIEIETTSKVAAGTARRVFACPVLARSKWLAKLIVTASLGALFFGAIEVIVEHGIRATIALLNTGVVDNSLEIPWGGLILGAVISLLAAFAANLFHVVWRSRELEAEFRRRWPSLEHPKSDLIK